MLSGIINFENMTEEFLHYLWNYKLFNSELKTTDGESVIINSSGIHNHDEGPDFFNARIKIGNTLWAGNIEIHINSSDWQIHSHNSNKLYDNVILHVVYKFDKTIFRNNGEKIPTLELIGKFDESFFSKYKAFITSKSWIPCENIFNKSENIVIKSWLNSIVFERFEKKAGCFQEFLKITNNDLHESFYILLARNFGFKINSDAFELLARSTPLKILNKHKDNLFQVEAILFGQAGMLEEDFEDEYPRMLKKEFNYLRTKYYLHHDNFNNWKFLRIRPLNFPTIRISQLANLIYKSDNLLNMVIDETNPEKIIEIFNCKTSEYFNDHFIFDKKTINKEKPLGKNASTLLIINVVVPFLFIYAKLKDNIFYSEKAIELLAMLPTEKNSIINKWKVIYPEINSSLESQAFIELKNNYCDKKRCLECRIGNFLLKN
jgi:hypothetical protein